MFKARDYVILIMIVILFSFGLMNLVLESLTNKNVNLSNDSLDYVNNVYKPTFDTMLNNQELSNEFGNLNSQNTNLTKVEQTNDFNRQFVETLKAQSKIEFIFTLTKNLPTFIVMSLGFDVKDYSMYINIIGWFLSAIILLTIVLFWFGVI